MAEPLVSIIMGSDSDLQVMQDAAKVLEEFGIAYELTVMSAHRTPDRSMEFAQQAHKRGVRVIIAAAGGAAHLAGVIAAASPLPVIGVPIKAKSLEGLDSLLSMVQMPSGIPVATVAIDGAKNAGLLAIRILGAGDSPTQQKVVDYQEKLKTQVLAKAEKLEALGYAEYLKQKGAKQ